MSYKTYTASMVATFTGRPASSYTSYLTASAVPQALLLFKIGTCLSSPDDLTEDQQQMVDFAIMSMADHIYLAQAYQEQAASPFNSETIGSYSYSKTARAASAGDPTGVVWFDMAVADLSVCDRASGDFAYGGISVFEHAEGGYLTTDHGQVVQWLTPVEVLESQRWGFDPVMGG